MSTVRHLRIRAVAGLRFGKFTDFAVDGLDGDFVVIHGRNEAGKSTLAEFLTWSIGGPYGDTANALRFGDGGTDAVGRLVATVDSEEIDISSRFRFLRNGKPRDLREARWQGRSIDGTGISTVLGNLVADDYHHVYHLLGNTLDEIEQDDGFEALLAKFAVGSMESELNPRDAIKSFDQRSRALEREARELTERLRALKSEIDEANSRPDELDQMHTRVAEITRRLEEIRSERAILGGRADVLGRAVGAFRANVTVRSAAAHLAATEVPDPAWTKAVGNLGEISALLDQRRQLDDRRLALEDDLLSLGRALGMDRTKISGLELDEAAQRLLRDAASHVVAADSAAAGATRDHADAASAMKAAQTVLEDAAVSLGVTVDDVATFHGREAAITDTYEVAVQWRGVANARATLQTEIDTANDQLTAAISQLGSAPSSAADLNRPTAAVIALAVGAVVAGAAALINPYLSVALGLAVGAGLIALTGRRRTANGADPSAVDQAKNRVSELRGRLEIEHGRERELEQRFARQAEAFGVGTSNPDRGMSLFGQVDKARQAWDHMRACSAALESAEQGLHEASTAVTVRRSTFDKLLAGHGLAFHLPLDSFDSWLTRCVTATEKAAASVETDGRIASITGRITALLADAAPLCTDLSDDSVRATIERHREIEAGHEVATRTLREARIALEAMVAGDTGAATLLEAGTSEGELQAEIADVRGRIDALDAEAEQLGSERGALGESIRAIADEEVLSDLLEERTRVEDQIAELQTAKATLGTASAILGASLEEFELTHQTPLISEAVEFLRRAIPDYGSVIYSSVNTDSPLERDAHGVRLPVSRLSTGARTALYVALRVALARADGTSRGIALPLLCDDPLVHVDDERAVALMQMMSETSRERQVIVFSCHERSVAAAESLGARIIRL